MFLEPTFEFTGVGVMLSSPCETESRDLIFSKDDVGHRRALLRIDRGESTLQRIFVQVRFALEKAHECVPSE